MNVNKLENIIRRIKTVDSNGEKLLACVRLLSELSEVIREHSERCKGHQKDVDRLKDRLCVSFWDEQPRSGGGWGNSWADSVQSYRVGDIQCKQVESDVLSALHESQRTGRDLQAEKTIIQQYITEFSRVRDELLHDIEPVNSVQADACSLLLASFDRDRWAGCKSRYHHVGSIHGHLIFRKDRQWKQGLKVNRRLLDKKGRKDGKVSVKRGEELAGKPASQPVHLRYEDRISYRLSRPLDHAEFPIVRLQKQANEVCPLGHYQTQWRVILRTLKTAKQHGIDKRRAAAIERVARNQTPQLPGVTVQMPLDVFRLVGSFTLSSDDFGADWNDRQYLPDLGTEVVVNVLSRKVYVPQMDQMQTEYAVGTTSVSVIDEILGRIRTDHREGNEVSIGTIKNNLIDRIRSHMRYSGGYRSMPTNPEETRKKNRSTVAEYCRKLLRLPEITLEDSYKSGNCKPGTHEFCQRFGIHSDRISGGELARKWRAANWQIDTLFLRAIDAAWTRFSPQKVG